MPSVSRTWRVPARFERVQRLALERLCQIVIVRRGFDDPKREQRIPDCVRITDRASNSRLSAARASASTSPCLSARFAAT